MNHDFSRGAKRPNSVTKAPRSRPAAIASTNDESLSARETLDPELTVPLIARSIRAGGTLTARTASFASRSMNDKYAVHRDLDHRV